MYSSAHWVCGNNSSLANDKNILGRRTTRGDRETEGLSLKLIFEGQEAALQVHQQFPVRKLLLSINIIYIQFLRGGIINEANGSL